MVGSELAVDERHLGQIKATPGILSGTPWLRRTAGVLAPEPLT